MVGWWVGSAMRLGGCQVRAQAEGVMKGQLLRIAGAMEDRCGASSPIYSATPEAAAGPRVTRLDQHAGEWNINDMHPKVTRRLYAPVDATSCHGYDDIWRDFQGFSLAAAPSLVPRNTMLDTRKV